MRTAWLVVVAIGCGGTQRSDAPVAPVVEVSDAGALPRDVVRVVVEDGAQRLELVAKFNVAIDGQRLELPAVTSIARVASTRDGRVQVVFEDHPTLKGARVNWRVGPTGEVSDQSYVDVPAGERDRLRQLLLAAGGRAVQFPDVPIGIGAKWRVATRMTDAAGLQWTVEQRHTLVERTATTASLTTQLEMRAPAQSVDGADVAAHATGNGTSVVPLNGRVATGTFDQRAALTVRKRGRTVKSLLATQATVRVLD
jgi:SH3-like domain-containing protein